MKRYPAEKELRRKASRDFYANEVCWGINIALNLGLTDGDAILQFIKDDFAKWEDHVDFETYD